MPFGLNFSFLRQKKDQPQDFRHAYKLGRKLGEGAFGVVHECRKRDNGLLNGGGGAEKDDVAPFAVKMIDRAESDTTGKKLELNIMLNKKKLSSKFRNIDPPGPVGPP